jgi:hypothetical protein
MFFNFFQTAISSKKMKGRHHKEFEVQLHEIKRLHAAHDSEQPE